MLGQWLGEVMRNVVETADWWDPGSLGGTLFGSRVLAVGDYWVNPRLSGGCMDRKTEQSGEGPRLAWELLASRPIVNS